MPRGARRSVNIENRRDEAWDTNLESSLNIEKPPGRFLNGHEFVSSSLLFGTQGGGVRWVGGRCGGGRGRGGIKSGQKSRFDKRFVVSVRR